MTFMNRIKHKYTLLLAIMLILGLALQMGIGGVFAENEKATTTTGEDGYIYFDLAAGNVNIGKNTYSGYVYVGGTATKVEGIHSETNKYYVYQSNITDASSEAHYINTGYQSKTEFGDGSDKGSNCRIPVYPRVQNDNKSWTDYITNNTDVKEVSEKWGNAAAASGRTATKNYINFANESEYTVDLTVDNIWSKYHQVSTSRTTGGIGAHLHNQKNTSISLHLKGDNRVGCVHYSSDRKSGNRLIFSNGDDDSTPGSITVADFSTNFGANHWNAAIGAADNPADSGDMSEGIEINSGVIYAGTTPEDNCTAIGGGGNQYGSVTINGGTVTAVVSSTGTAIGGGIGYSNKGGDTDVIINDGTIYAYNLGIKKEEGDNFNKFVPAAAIGGGGSNGQAGGLQANITINGGEIYAQSMGGAAIGGGCSANDAGGPATINITGGTIIAKSIGGKYGTETIDPGVSIGGGTGKTAGGTVTLNISEDSGNKTIIRTGSIGGGLATQKGAKVGSANVTVAGGDITGQVVMAGGAANPCSFTMTGGRIHSTNVIEGVAISETNDTDVTVTDPNPSASISFIRKNGGAVFINDPNGVAKISGGTIEGCTAYRGGAVYMEGGNFSLSDKGSISKNTAKKELDDSGNPVADGTTGYGGGVYVNNGNADINGGNILKNKAQIRGGGLYVQGGNVTVSDGLIKENEAGFNIPDGTADVGRGGGVYLDGGVFTMNGGVISENSALYRGGGIFLTKSPELNGGTISGNTAIDNGGGLCIVNCVVDLEPKNDLTISGNKAKNGGGISIFDNSGGSGGTGGSETTGSSEKSVDTTDTVTGASEIPEGSVGLRVNSGTKGTLHFDNNIATADKDGNGGNGGAVCVDGGRFQLDSNRITIKENEAANGGGVAVLNGNFTMTDGSIGAENFANEAKNGGGVYVSGGEIWFKGGSINHNKAKNGGGAYVAGNYNMLDGSVVSNTAAENGGGVFVNDGTVTMYGGSVDLNTAEKNGGGMHVSSADKDALVDIFSGSISNNISGESGGGISVVSSEDKKIDVTVGINHEHPGLSNGTFNEFGYPDGDKIKEYGNAHKVHTNHIYSYNLKHSSCPQVKSNVATDNGGGFFLNSANSNITIYCLEAQENMATNDPDSHCMDVEGGKLQIGDEDFDIHINPDGSDAKGNTTIYGSIMVKGGKVDIYGEMENPKFMQDVKVDVKSKEDHYLDHRIIENGHKDYKVHYYENFKNDDGTITGLYIARQYPDADHVNLPDEDKYKFTVMSSIFTRPGYKIVGWDTKPDDTGVDYNVNETYDLSKLGVADGMGANASTGVGTHSDEYLLVLYAIWERTEYVLKFDPNVEAGETYTGTMENQPVMIGKIDGSQQIKKNKFERPGYKFLGWTLTPTPTDTDTVYEDGHSIITDFTEEDGATVTLYAKWEKCEHIGYLTYTADKNVLTEKCSACGNHTATATLSAVDSTYDGNTHLATVNFSDNWLGYKPAISYEMAEDKEWDSEDGVVNEWKSNPQPVHAGAYTAKITAENKTDNAESTAQVEYTISPVKWETPKSPQILFKLEKDGDKDKSIIEITEPQGDNIKYMIKRLNISTNKIEDIPEYTGWLTNRKFSNIPFGYYYYFYAKKCADRDHLESEESRSDAYLADGGNIVYIKNAEGIKVEPDLGSGSFKYTVSADEGYHLRNYTYKESDSEIPGAVGAHKDTDSITITKSGPTDDKYTYEVTFETNKVAYWQVTLEFSGAAKNASVAHKVTDGQVFRDFNSKETSISRDSAFTAQFTVSDYIPAEYEVPVLKFSEELPEDTTVIMKTDGGYWHYRLSVAKDSIALTDFTAMGGTEKFKFNKDEDTVKAPFTYQFIVDFSQSEGATIDADKLKVNLNLNAVEPENPASEIAPTIPADGKNHISLDIKEKATFNIKVLEAILGKSANITCGYKPSDGAASIWNDRETALVLTAKSDVEIPADLTLKTVVDGKNTLYTMNSKKQFIIPLGEIGDRSIQATLNSGLFGDSPKDLAFTADWYVSQSRADKSPLNGYKAATYNNNIKFSCQKDTLPSVRIDGEKRICEQGGSLSVDVKYKGIPAGNKIKAYLQKKNDDGTYSETGANVEILDGKQSAVTSEKDETISFSMGNMDKGTYRILVIVEEGSANILQVPYYFIIK